MKLLVESRGPWVLMNPVITGEVVPHNRPAVIRNSPWVGAQIAQEHMRVLHELPDEATDADFLLWWRECDAKRDLAIASYIAAHTKDKDASDGEESSQSEVEGEGEGRAEGGEDSRGPEGVEGASEEGRGRRRRT